MKQLLIVKSDKQLNDTGATPNDLSKLKSGAIMFFELDSDIAMVNKPTKNFGIALGRPNGQLPFVIPEVDISTLTITKSDGREGKYFKVEFSMPNPEVDKEYTLRFFKHGTQPHERNSWTVGIVAKTTNANTEAERFEKILNDKISNDFPFRIERDGSNFKLESNVDWTIQAVDSFPQGALTITSLEPAIGDKRYIQDLASRCAAGKGFTETYRDGANTIPGYPEEVEDVIYDVYTLRFQVGRDSSKTRDEKVWQLVHIAVVQGTSVDEDMFQIFYDFINIETQEVAV